MNFVKSSLKYPQVTLSVLLLVFAVGVYSLLNMPRREDPKITVRQGLVLAFFPGANSAQVEDQVTRKLEQYLFQFEEIRKEKTYSTSQDGMVVVNVELGENVKNPDVFWSKLRHQLLVARQVDFPKGVRGPIVNSDFGDTEALVIGIESNKATYAQLRDYTQKLEDVLRTVKSVSKIKRIGEQKEQITVTCSSEKLSQYNVRLSQVIQVLQSQNVISPTGDIKTATSQTPLYTSGYFSTENEIANQIVGATQTGELIRVGDMAQVKREYTEPTSKTTVNGNNAMMLAIQMQEGNNIVKFGEEVAAKLAETEKRLPSDVKLTTIVNQPHLVDENITHFIREFFLAIFSVVVVVILLLPLRIAAVAAMAIPMTIAVTFALLNAFSIELHQVSLAGLIVVLGMVVDDAIVIADNYVELLDEGIDRWTAAWRSATDLVIPVLAATVTIIASFMPMVILTGSVGEFIHTLPITVTIALAASFIVAMILTPLLCYTFIKKGLHDHSAENADRKKRVSLLDRMQNGYNSALEWCVRHSGLTIGVSLITVVLSGFVYQGIKQKFFPAAERNQFVIELWMPTGTKLDQTSQAILKAEKLVKGDPRVTSYATFTGTSAPRFYYNFSPEVPVTNYAQILINTTDDQTAEEFARDLDGKLAALIPEGSPEVKLMQQGSPYKSPVEVRIVGDDITHLKAIGAQVLDIVQKANGSTMVRSDFREDYYGISIQLKDEANKLGFTTGSISQMIYTGFNGAPVSTMYEGNNPLDIVFRLDEQNRQSSDNLENTYISSPVTDASVPLRQIADLKPQWQTGKIMHRNGVRTLTVLSETEGDVLPADLVKEISPKIADLPLPAGYRIEYGGEQFNKNETFSQMMVVLAISLVLIFFILLFQFRSLKEAMLVMLTIPLSLFGALIGLYITHNNFGFTAFVGLISLSGIVVRNAIILVDHTNELLGHGMDIRTAAIESGKRRLRPIFLTAMAAAIGVLPMILSGSPMWSPLASVIAVGVIWSMVMALLTVPVLYIAMIKPHDKKDLMVTPVAEHHEN
ncbi:resistance-nodulation-cell division (RND) efflux transporter [Dyadobacter beijingensis]|uniref:Resistance-nodulation-cell division (RND) efflux transporter n=1 Tax=Dyadobacter beijingensis TaxID=365489 RepID=A0ABQ2I1G8_9BACT|nr:efflux RND transporter permease subunit [Dyadobacter beijingensis]GGM94484.1 resistance-nodulation-cell division (RND) efflux transporter [Dyadobacter beijingensis]